MPFYASNDVYSLSKEILDKPFKVTSDGSNYRAFCLFETVRGSPISSVQ